MIFKNILVVSTLRNLHESLAFLSQQKTNLFSKQTFFHEKNVLYGSHIFKDSCLLNFPVHINGSFIAKQ